jgi:hypothetical protein
VYECCKTCNYCCSVRKHPTYQEILTHICVFFLVQEGADYILEVAEDDVCECYSKRVNI